MKIWGKKSYILYRMFKGMWVGGLNKVHENFLRPAARTEKIVMTEIIFTSDMIYYDNN